VSRQGLRRNPSAALFDPDQYRCYKEFSLIGGAVAQLGARLDGIEEVVGSNPIGSTKTPHLIPLPSESLSC
jgi:hypothetical protein